MRRAIISLSIFVLSGCSQKMADSGAFKPLDPAHFFADGRSSRNIVPGTIPHSNNPLESSYITGLLNGVPVSKYPMKVTKDILLRGQERFNIYCAVCHGRDGYGQGIVVKRGFIPPPSYHIDRLRNSPPGYFVEVITSGKGAMYSYASRVAPRDRWAIAAYIQALQLSQNAKLSDVPDDDKRALEARLE